MHTGHVLVGAYVYVSLISSAVAHHQFLYDLGGWIRVLHYMSLYWSWFYIWCPKFWGTTMISDWVYHYFGSYNVSWMCNEVYIRPHITWFWEMALFLEYIDTDKVDLFNGFTFWRWSSRWWLFMTIRSIIIFLLNVIK